MDMMSSMVLVSDLTEVETEEQKRIMSRLLNVDSSFRQLALINSSGEELRQDFPPGFISRCTSLQKKI